jgi:putative hydrolase of the HAD superfamily
VKHALLFDLDETLMVEEPAAEAAFLASAQFAAGRGVDPATLALEARSWARELWYSSPTHGYCMRVGISSWEGLWCRFEGDRAEVRALREWSPTYRIETWRLALLDQGVEDPVLAEELAGRFVTERRARHEVFGDVAAVLGGLAESHRLALLTNGASCLQREKLSASGLSEYFEVVLVSSDLGTAKPDPALFEHALDLLDADPRQTFMVGDSIAKDVEGALVAGIGAVWVNRARREPPADRPDIVQVTTLSDLPRTLVAGAPNRK